MDEHFSQGNSFKICKEQITFMLLKFFKEEKIKNRHLWGILFYGISITLI